MGTFIYGSARSELQVEDRTLAHLKVVILSKLRRNECFAMSWDTPVEDGSGRSTIWVHPAMNLEFHFVGSRRPELDREWVEVLLQAANSAEGLRMIPEPSNSTA